MTKEKNKTYPKYIYLLSILCISLLSLYSSNKTQAEDLKSNNYKIVDATVNSSGETLNSSSYKTVTAIGDFSSNPRYYSNSYQTKGGTPELFTANTPKVLCFETTTDGTSNCSNGPSYLNTNGMVTVCGKFGCYDKARVEIDTQNNPSDTKYSIEISTDNFSSDVEVIDPTSRLPKDASNKTSDDFITADEWHDYDNSHSTNWTHGYNIQGLKPNTQYWVRITALNGDLTESSPSPTSTSSTTEPTLSFDIDIANSSQSTTETTPPHKINMFLIPDTVVTADDTIWQDISSNITNGIDITVQGQYGGLYNSNSNHTITSQTVDLNTVSEGFGLQKSSTTQSYDSTAGTGALAEISTVSDYNTVGTNVGKVETSTNNIFYTNGPLYNGKTDTLIKARATNTTPQGTYTETITFYAKTKL